MLSVCSVSCVPVSVPCAIAGSCATARSCTAAVAPCQPPQRCLFTASRCLPMKAPVGESQSRLFQLGKVLSKPCSVVCPLSHEEARAHL